MLATRAGQLASYLLVRLAFCVLQSLRIETSQRLARLLATLSADVLRLRRKVVDENLRCAYPQLDTLKRRRLAREMWYHLYLSVAEMALMRRKIHETNWRKTIRLSAVDRVVEVLLQDRPVLIVSAHFGNFELAGYVLGMMGFPTFSVARKLDNPYLDRFINRFRGVTGQHIVPKKGGYDQIVQVLNRGGAMAFLADQYAGTKGCWVDFFGRPASAHKAIALFCLEHDAPLVVAAAQRIAGAFHYDVATHAVLDPRRLTDEQANVTYLTQWYTSMLETLIRQAPDQYWWLHRRWKDNRPARRRQRHQTQRVGPRHENPAHATPTPAPRATTDRSDGNQPRAG